MFPDILYIYIERERERESARALNPVSQKNSCKFHTDAVITWLHASKRFWRVKKMLRIDFYHTKSTLKSS